MKRTLISLFSLMLLLPVCAVAQDDDDDWFPLQEGTVSFRIGGFIPRGESDIWEQNTQDFTFEVDDFKNFMIGVEFNWFLNKYLTVGFAVDAYNKSVSTEYRDYVDNNGDPIFQKIELTIVPITGTVKFTPLGNGSPGYRGERGTGIVPWIGGGVGIYPFTYEETGDFIDFDDDMNIISGTFITDEEAAVGFHAAAGLVVPIGLTWDLFGEVRYAWVEGELSEDFLGFDPIDLGGASFCFGASYRF